MSEFIIRVDENYERWHYVVQQYTHFFGYPITEQIVRCRDCRYYSHYQDLCERLKPGMLVLEPDDGFCAWGERKDGDAR